MSEKTYAASVVLLFLITVLFATWALMEMGSADKWRRRAVEYYISAEHWKVIANSRKLVAENSSRLVAEMLGTNHSAVCQQAIEIQGSKSKVVSNSLICVHGETESCWFFNSNAATHSRKGRQ